jgi:hypothetical protein
MPRGERVEAPGDTSSGFEPAALQSSFMSEAPHASPVVPARLKPGVRIEQIESLAPRPGGNAAVTETAIRGKALIFWDPARPGQKRDAIDTDQITPAADCVSESLDTLDERWKAGSFRYLMPDFRRRVHAGETFLIAGERFAIGSSREMSPAGLKGVADEAGREMVVVCGNNMGDIFRRNALNLGLHVVQSPETHSPSTPRRACSPTSRAAGATSRCRSPRRKRRSAGAAASSRSAGASSRRRPAPPRASSSRTPQPHCG